MRMIDEEQDTAVAEPIVTTQVAPKSKADPRSETQHLPPYHVIILNDEEHTFEYVIELLAKVFGHSLDAAKALTWRVHNEGRAVVYTTHKEKAELKRDQALAFGSDPWSDVPTGPIGCYIEPAATD
jgi:ATP-dependent Clp protease adaptor protein ClpS